MNHFPPLTTSQYQHLAADLDVPVAGFPYPTQQDMKAGNAIRVLVSERDALQVRLIQQVTLVEQCMVEMNRNADMGEKAEKERDAALDKLQELERQEPCAIFLGWNDDDTANLDAACEGPETLKGENVLLYLAALL